ncbi:MAG: helix-turn-helix transcriptional regulator [Actinomycetota bacterium]|nr:helix-turn-helix transcriptional regulator [Actinomycetota bacterium]
MSPVFRHGSLRLYLLRLLDEEPRHGYEVIRLLRDRFMGVYSPSPGTIYPRLARLEEEGLVTHDEVDGRKVYRITEAGRAELASRSDELDELEEELSASVSDIVREVREDVRQTVRSLREELTWAARESRRVSKDAAADVREQARQARDQAGQAGEDAREQARQATQDTRDQTRRIRDEVREQVRQARETAREQSRQAREDAWEQGTRDDEQDPGAGAGAGSGSGSGAGAGSGASWRVHEQARRLREEAASARFTTGEQDWDTPGGSAWSAWSDWPGRQDWSRMRGRPGWSESLDFGTLRDLERLAVQFTSDLRKLATQSSTAGENVINDLRTILEEALERIKTEIFGSGHEGPGTAEEQNPEEHPGQD